jgi:hypothetical protein
MPEHSDVARLHAENAERALRSESKVFNSHYTVFTRGRNMVTRQRVPFAALYRIAEYRKPHDFAPIIAKKASILFQKYTY